MSRLLKQGCQLPDPAEMSVADPKLMAWLHEPQLLQRDEKEIEGYTLQVPAYPHTLYMLVACHSLLALLIDACLMFLLSTIHQSNLSF